MQPAHHPRSLQRLAAWLLPLVTFSAVSIGHAQPANLNLPAPAQGSAAIAALGSRLPEVAKAYGLKAQDLATLFQTQPSLAVDQAGALLFLCEGEAVPRSRQDHKGGARSSVESMLEEDALTASSSVTALATGGTVDAFNLHSLPGATRVLYLDFTGHTTSGTGWNSSYGGGNPIVSAPFSLDSDNTTFSATERSMIQRIWQRVAEDYAPFNVDVTTQDPGVENLRRTSSTDTAYGMRVVISPTNWYKSTAGGVAYIGSFSSSIDEPCFAFTQQLANNEKYIAEAVSHEAGHTVSLYHDGVGGTSPTGYYEGQGSWAPIMGVGYYKPLVQFSKGEYANANNLQDDIAVISNHIPLAGDDHGDSLSSATSLLGPAVADGGTIDTRADVDLFRFDTGAGAISFSVKGPAPDTDLDLKVELLSSTGAVIQLSDPTTSFAASIAASVGAGTYYLRVSGVAAGDPLSTGYSDYASVGNYIITGTFITTGLKQAPVAAITASTFTGTVPLTVNFSGQGSRDADGVIAGYQWNFGTGDAGTGVSSSYTFTTSGTFTTELTVLDNEGLAGTTSVTITVAAAANVPPIAVASANITAGTAPVPIAFSGTTSADPDGVISAYRWDFGDGSSSTAASASKTYTTPGNYAARLTVTDNRGATASSTVNISISSDPSADADVQSFGLTMIKQKSGFATTATVAIRDRLNRAVSGATVSVQWSGVISATTTGQTDGTGKLVLSAPRTKRAGTVTAKITALTPPGGAYDPTIFATSVEQVIVLK